MYKSGAIMNKWPDKGMKAVDLLKMQHHIMIDAKLINSKGFQLFYSNWIMNDLSSDNSMFIQSLESDGFKISTNWGAIKPFICKNYEDYGSAIKDIGGSWIYITNNIEKAESLRRVFKNVGISMRVYRMDEEGRLQNYRPQYQRPYEGKVQKEGFVNDRSVITKKEKIKRMFELPSEIYPVTKMVYSSENVPSKMDFVYDSNHQMIRLEDEFISNPQSITYQTSLLGMQAKIYQKSWLQISYFKDKAEKMINNPISFEGICWPKDILYDKNGDFVGILVPKAEGYQLKQDIMSQAGIETHFPMWDRRDLTHLAKIILEKIAFLQERNVIFGLINPNAIFVKDADHVYFADMDTYQIEGYPILAYERVMQAPELQNIDNSLRLYSKQQDNYEIAMLLFMILMPGKFPYNKGKNTDISESIKRMMFAFRYGEGQASEHGAREYFGLWRFVWSHLGNDLKKAFYFTFQSGQPYSLPEKRKYASFWLMRVQELEKELANPYDKESLRIFPRTFKRYNGTKTIRCIKCGIEHPSFYYRYPEKQICNSCLGQPSEVHFVCKSCQKIYYYDFSTLFKYEKLVETKNFKMPTHCPYCRSDKERCKGDCGKMVPSYRLDKNGMCPDCAKKARDRIVKSYQCRDCGRWIELTQGQIEFYERKSMNLPVRCDICRNKRRNRY